MPAPRQVPSPPLGADLTLPGGASTRFPGRHTDADTPGPGILRSGCRPGAPARESLPRPALHLWLTLWLPATTWRPPNLGRAHHPGLAAFACLRRGSLGLSPPAPACPGVSREMAAAGQSGPGLHPVESPAWGGFAPGRGRCDRAPGSGDLAVPWGGGDPLSSRWTRPLEPVAAAWCCAQFSPARAGVGEPVIRTPHPGAMEGGWQPPAPCRLPPLPAGLSMKPDGEQHRSDSWPRGRFCFERQWRRPLTADEWAGGAMCCPRPCAGSTPRAAASRRRACPHILWCSRQGERHSCLPAPGSSISVRCSWPILLRAFMRRWPRWRAFYRLQAGPRHGLS